MPKQARTRSVLLAALLVLSGLAFVPQVDAAVINISTLTFSDADANGHVDRVAVVMSGNIQGSSIRPSDFIISVQAQPTVIATSIVPGTITATGFTLTFPESANLDGGSQSTSSVTLGSGPSLAPASTSDSVSFTGGTKVDNVPPLLMAMYGEAGSDKVVAAFSESVKGAGANFATTDFPTITCSGRTITAVSTIASGQFVSIKLSSALSAGDLTGTCTIAPAAAVNDNAATPHTLVSTAAVQVAGPLIKYVHGNRGDTRVVVDFFGPVSTASGQLTVNTAGGGSFNGFTTTTFNANSNRIVLAATNAPVAADFTGGSGVQQTAGVLGPQGPSVTSQTPTPVAATDFSTNDLDDAKEASDDNIAPPFPVSMTTLDLYTGAPVGTPGADGCLDTIRVRFNEHVSDATVTGTLAKWVMAVPGETAARAFTGMVTTDALDTATSPASVADDSVVYLQFNPGTCDNTSKVRTNATPALSYCDTTAARLATMTADYTLYGPPTVTACATYITDMASPAVNLQADTGGAQIVRLFPTTDGARPSILQALSIDSGTVPNGKVDQILIQFSEPVDDAPLLASEWQVQDGAAVPYTVTAVNTGVTANDDTIFLVVTEKPTTDTGMVPDVAYTASTAARVSEWINGAAGPLDVANVPFNGAGSIGAGREKDGAAPVLMSLFGTVGSASSLAIFSEDMTALCTASCVNKLRYRDNNLAGVTGMAAALTDTTDTSGKTVAVTLNTLLTAGDLTGGTRDCMQLRKDTVTPANSFRDPALNQGYPDDTLTPVTAGTTCVGFTAASGPTLTTAATQDLDQDGYLDAVKLTFSGSVNDAFGAAATWSIKFGTNPAINPKDVVTGTFPGSSTVIVSDADVSTGTLGTADALVKFVDTGSVGYQAGECVYSSADGTVSTGDLRITRCGNYFATRPGETGVAATDADVGGTLGALANARALDFTGGTANAYNLGECLYISTDANVGAGDTRVNVCSVVAPSGGPLPVTAGPRSLCRGATSPNARQDNVIFLCFTEQVDGSAVLLPNTGSLPTVSYSGTSLKDASGANPVGTFTDVATIDGAAPVLVRAQANPGSTAFDLRFSEMVVAGGSPITPTAMLYSNSVSGTDASCPSGASNVATIATYASPVGGGFVDITGTVNGAFTFYDIAAGLTGATCPSGQTRDGIRPNTSLVQEPTSAANPPKFAVLGPLGDNGAAINGGTVPFVDNGKPSIASAGFVDINGDGTVDAVQVRFSEAVLDSSIDTTVSTGNVDWVVNAGTAPIQVTSIQTGTNVLTAPASQSCTGTFLPADKSAPYDNTNDEYLMLCLQTAVGAPQSTFGLGTGITGTVAYAPAGTTNAAARITDRVLAPNAHTLDNTAAPVPVVDAARPVILNTVDATNPTPVSGDARDLKYETADRNHDGFLDAVKVTFSEPVTDASFNLVDWSISGHAVTGIDTEGNADGNPAAGTVNDATIWITFTPGNTADTGIGSSPSQTNPNPATPTLTYVEAGGMKDAANNKVRGLSGQSTRDGAAPVLRSVQAIVGQSAVTVTFSEPVRGSGANGAITLADVSFQNNAAGGAASVSSVLHTMYDPGMTVILNAPVTQADIDADKLVFVTSSILSRNSLASLVAADPTNFTHPLNLFNTYGPLSGDIGDVIAPAAITDLEVTEVDTGKVTLQWTTPDENDLNPTGKFQVYFCASDDPCTLTQSSFLTDGTLFETGVPTPDAGEVQDVDVTGTGILTDGTEYQFLVITLDNNGNPSAISNVVKAIPAPHITADQEAVTDLQRTSSTANSITVSWKVPPVAAGTTLTGYRIVVKPAAQAVLSQAAFEAAAEATFTLSPSSLADAGETQKATITGLISGTNYRIYVALVDDQLPANIGELASTTAKAEVVVTPPVSAVDDLVVDEASITPESVKLTWSPNAAAEGVAHYHIELAVKTGSSCPTSYGPATPDEVTGTTATLTGLTPGTVYCFRVYAANADDVDGPKTAVVQATTAADPDAIASDDLAAVNEALSGSLEAKYTKDGVKLTWDTPADVEGQTLAGFQIWKCATPIPADTTDHSCSTFVYVGQAGADDRSFTDPNGFIDLEGAADAYVVTAFYGPGVQDGKQSQSATSLAAVPGATTNDPVVATQSSGNSLLSGPWLWIILGALLLLIILVVLFFVLRARKNKGGGLAGGEGEGALVDGGEGAEASWDQAPAAEQPQATWDAAPEAAAAAAPAAEPVAAAPQAQQTVQQSAGSSETSYLSCPQCSTVFRATGKRPFVAQCPTCGVKGRFT